ELLDEDVVHAVAGAAPRRGTGRGRLARPLGTPALERLEALLVGEDRERLDQDLRGLAERRLRLHRAVGLDVERELVVVGPLADSRRLDAVRDALDGRDDRVDGDQADRLVV